MLVDASSMAGVVVAVAVVSALVGSVCGKELLPTDTVGSDGVVWMPVGVVFLGSAGGGVDGLTPQSFSCVASWSVRKHFTAVAC